MDMEAAVDISPMPGYLRAEYFFGVIVCTEHRTAYTPANLINHLVHMHHLKGSQKKSVESWLISAPFSSSVREPSHHSVPVAGLEVLRGWACNVGTCGAVSQSLQTVERHCSKDHGLNSKRRREDGGAISQVSLQRWFAKSNKYWIVDPRLVSSTSTPSQHGPLSRTAPLRRPLPSTDSLVPPGHGQSFLHQLSQTITAERRERSHSVQEPEHTSELSPWLRLCKYHEHLVNLDSAKILESYIVPQRVVEHPTLYYITKSIVRVLKNAHQSIATLHHVDARRLNTFQLGTLSQDPFNRLQEASSLDRYSQCFARLLCFIYRAQEEDHFPREMFCLTPPQEAALHRLCQIVDSLVTHHSTRSECDVRSFNETNSSSDDAETLRLEADVDNRTLSLCTALIQHRMIETSFESPIMSFCAVVSWDAHSNSWKTENQCASILSQMIYCCQLVILAECHRLVDDQGVGDLSQVLERLCSRWLLNSTRGPISDMLRLRLYAMKVAGNTVHPAQIRWRSDGQTLHYQDITYRLADLATEIDYCIQHARKIFLNDLCLGLEPVPSIRLTDLEDNWDARQPGASFLTDMRNAICLEGLDTWLIDRITNRPDLYDLIVQRPPDGRVENHQIRSTFAHEYEKSVQKFLSFMAILIHKGSGQPGRSREFLSMRWENKDMAGRNIFIHDGFVIFILHYHKALSRTHASRFPVRFLLPEAGVLLVQFLILVQPLRRLLSKAVGTPVTVSEYLWHNGEDIWLGPHLTRYARDISQAAIGVAVNMRSWRQIAVAIALKKFGGMVTQADLALAEEGDDDSDDDTVHRAPVLDAGGGGIAEVFHLQATHSAFTGNRIYGGTVNFEAGLTDAGLQEFFKASRMWHGICRPRTLARTAGHRRLASADLPPTTHPPLRKRLAIRQSSRRRRPRFGTEQLRAGLQKLFPHTDAPQFRSPSQEGLLEAIATGHSEVVGVLGTGEGKSLAFLLPSCLPNAAMTVVVVPLVALKTDLIRRCREFGLSFAVWDPSADSRRYIQTPLLFVSTDEAVGSRFRIFIGQLDAAEGIDRIVFDEAHLILTGASYRPKMALVRQLRSLFCQVVFLTGTLPPSMQAQFEARVLLHQPCVIRSRTFRRDIVYSVRRSKDIDLQAYVLKGIRRLLQRYEDQPEARLIVYTLSRAEADQLSGKLDCPKYYSDSGEVEEKHEAMEAWRRGKSKVMVATSAFGMGIDFSSVRQVIHVGAPREMIGFAQEVGRLSRDGGGGSSQVVLPWDWQAAPLPRVVDQQRSSVSELAMQVYLGDNRCLSAVLSRFLDGVEQMRYCQSPAQQQRCSGCARLGIFPVDGEADETPWWDGQSGLGAEYDPEEEELEEEELEEEEEEEESGEEGGAEERVGHGHQRLRESVRAAALGRQRYENWLSTFQGRCMICMILGSGQIRREQQWHSLRSCPHTGRAEFFRAKQAAIERNRHCGGWVQGFVACFRCGQPQEICPVEPIPDGRGSRCQYGDMVFPAGWALFQRRQHWGRTLGELSGARSGEWSSEERWMDWLGTECEMYGMRACQAARMLDLIIQIETGEISHGLTGGHQNSQVYS